MTETDWFDSEAEAKAFARGLYIGGRHGYFVRFTGKWEVRYWRNDR